MQNQLELFATEEDLENASLYEPSSFVGVVFTDSSATSYKLRFPYNQLPPPSDYTESFGKVSSLCLNCIHFLSHTSHSSLESFNASPDTCR